VRCYVVYVALNRRTARLARNSAKLDKVNLAIVLIAYPSFPSGQEKAVVPPVFHALTGCDTVLSINGKGKKSDYDTLGLET